MSPDATPANEDRYRADQARNLSTVQRRLLRRAVEGRVALRSSEIPAAMGLERRDLARTHRPTVSTFSRRPVPGSTRTMHLTVAGRLLAGDLPPLTGPDPDEPELDLAEARRLLRGLAEDLLDAQPTPKQANRARAILDRLDGA